MGLAPILTPMPTEPEQLKSGKASNKYTISYLSATNSFLLSSFLFLGEEARPGNGFFFLRGGNEARVPRKEVIQPHLPVRLPCYDFTPITNPTLDACLLERLAQRLQVLPTFVV